MHGPELHDEALRLIADGLSDGAVGQRLGLPRTTVRDWRRPPYRATRSREACPRCWRPSTEMAFAQGDYAELLALYLGDGHISRVGRVYRLRISLDTKYPVIIADARGLITRCFSSSSVGWQSADGGSTTILFVYSAHLPCLFPQHGPGKKHERRIVLEAWQAELVRESPWSFIRGCIRSDGCVFINRTGRYEYLSYDFSNLSVDIRALFMGACDVVGVEYRGYPKRVRVYRRASVALLEANVGLKS